MAAVRRTRAEKELASIRRSEQMQYTFQAAPVGAKSAKSQSTTKKTSAQPLKDTYALFGYDPRLILGDLRTSVLISLLLIIGLIVFSRV